MKTYSFKTFLLVFLLVVLSNNVFCQGNSDVDNRMKIRLGFTSVNNIHRQILVTADTNATSGIDFGYDAENFENHIDDMYWMIDDRKFLIQGIDVIDETTSLQLGLHTNTSGDNIISIDELINVPNDLEIGIFDNITNTYYDIRQNSSFTINLPEGEYLSRFTLKFVNDNNLSIEDIENSTNLELSYINSIKSISIKNIGSQIIKSVEVYNINGQLITKYNDINATDHALIQTYNLITGNYVLILTTDLGKTSKKVTVR